MAPASQPMDNRLSLGLWRSSFGPVKIETDDSRGASHIMGVWVYDRAGTEVVGFFSGPLDGNVLNFVWREPTDAEPLKGRGYLVFDPSGASFTGRWWTESQDRSGEWNGWRAAAQPASPAPGQPAPNQPAPPTGPAEQAPVDPGQPPAGAPPPPTGPPNYDA